MAFSVLVSSMTMLLIMVIPGFIFKRANMINDIQVKGLSTILVNLIVPCIVINSFQREYTKELSMNVLKIGGMWAIMIVVSFLIIFLVSKHMKFTKIESGILSAVLMIPNTGYIGIPIVQAFLGGDGVFFIAVCDVINDIFVFSVVYQIMNRSLELERKFSLREFFQPPTIAILIGYSLFLMDIRLPQVVGEAIQKISMAATAIAMFVIGAQLERLTPKSFLGKPKLYAGVFGRLLLMPAIAIFVVIVLLGQKDLVATVFILGWAMPAGVFAVIFSENLNIDPSFATENVMLSNILCLFSLPIWMMIVSQILS